MGAGYRGTGGLARREALISVAGLTPQIITETLYYLTQVRRPPAQISEIWVITTVPGREKVLRELLGSRGGHFFQFCREYRLDPKAIHFGPETVLVVQDHGGRPLEDIRTPEENAALADFITAFIREKAADPGIRLHCSVAGGRKTMSLYLGLALQFYGRPGDTLSHVLVWPPELEGHGEFYYPPRRGGTIRVKGRRLSTGKIKIELAEIPILLLRGKLHATDSGRPSYTHLVHRAQEDYAMLNAPPRAVVARQTYNLIVGNRQVRLTPLETALYVIFAQARRASCGRAGCAGCDKCTFAATDFLGEDGLERVRQALRTLKAKDARLQELRGWGTADPTDAEKRFREVRSRLNRKIQRGLGGDVWPALYTIAALRLPGEDRVRYGIRLDPRLLIVR